MISNIVGMLSHRLTAAIFLIATPVVAEDQLYDAANNCSNAILERYATNTCERIEDIAEVAFDQCKDKWDVFVDQLNIVKPNDVVGLGKYYSNHTRLYEESRSAYKRQSRSLAFELRAIAGTCGPH